MARSDAGRSKAEDAKEIAEWKAKIAQKQAQINDITEELAQKYGYEAKNDQRLQPRRRVEELIRWRLWNRTAAA